MNTFFMAATLVMLTTIVSAAEKNLYVSPEGKDSNPGTEALPFLTITKARDHIRGLAKTAPRGNIVVFLRGGIYRVEKTIVFGEADAAGPGHTITYRAYPGETPVLSASAPINGWNKEKLANGKMVWSADVSALLARRGQMDFCGVGALDSRAKTSFFTLYDAEGELPRARGPGFQAKPLPEADEKSTDKIYFPKGALKPWTDLPGAELVIIPRYHWNMNILPLAAVDPQGFATTARPGTYPLAPNPITERPTVWVENVLDVLDEPGEWVLHPAQGKLYLLPRAGQPKEIEAPLLTELIRVQGGGLITKARSIVRYAASSSRGSPSHGATAFPGVARPDWGCSMTGRCSTCPRPSSASAARRSVPSSTVVSPTPATPGSGPTCTRRRSASKVQCSSGWGERQSSSLATVPAPKM
jgi:hypothetical protein